MTKQELEYDLKLKITECEMFNNTVMQMYKKGAPQMAIDTVQSEIMSKMSEISKLREKINNCDYDKEKVEYSFNSYAQPKKIEKNSFYDSIVKQNKACDFIKTEDEKKKIGEKKLSYEDVYKKEKNKNFNIREMVDDISLCNSSISSNLFLVDLEELGIEKNKVKTVDFDESRNKIFITLYDHMVNTEDWSGDDKTTPLMSVLTAVKKLERKFDFKILHIVDDGTPIYVEKYNNAKIYDIWRSSLEYSSDAFAVIRVELKYDNVYYETADTKED
jgi:hypothetical protein